MKERQTDRQTDRQTNTETDKIWRSPTVTTKYILGSERMTDRQADRQADGQTERHIVTETERETDI